MKFKENAIKPGMVIHCQKEEDARALCEHMDELGYRRRDGGSPLKEPFRVGYYEIKRNRFDIRITPDYGETITEFSDLIEPDDLPVNSDTDSPMSAKELLEWFRRNKDTGIIYDMFSVEFEELFDYATNEEIIDKITAYEASKKAPKPVEAEWVDICRIIQMQDNGFKKCVYEEELPDSYGYATTENILKKYISEHEGQYIAVMEDVCRVKEDK